MRKQAPWTWLHLKKLRIIVRIGAPDTRRRCDFRDPKRKNWKLKVLIEVSDRVTFIVTANMVPGRMIMCNQGIQITSALLILCNRQRTHAVWTWMYRSAWVEWAARVWFFASKDCSLACSLSWEGRVYWLFVEFFRRWWMNECFGVIKCCMHNNWKYFGKPGPPMST